MFVGFVFHSLFLFIYFNIVLLVLCSLLHYVLGMCVDPEFVFYREVVFCLNGVSMNFWVSETCCTVFLVLCFFFYFYLSFLFV